MGNISNVSETLQQLANGSGNSYINSATLVGVSAAGIVIGLLICFLGVKIMKLLAGVLGMVIGAAVGALVGTLLQVDSMPMVIIVVIAAILGAVLMIFLRRLASFVLVLVYALSICSVLPNPQDNIILTIICIVIPLILAILAAVFVDPLIILLTGLSGGLSVGTAVASLIKIDNSYVGYGIGLMVAIIGILVQFYMYSKKQAKHDKQKSKAFKDQGSRESEVERARHLLEDDDDEVDDAGLEDDWNNDDEVDDVDLEDDLDYLDEEDDYLDD